VHEAEKLSLDQIEAFLNASQEIRFEGENRGHVYGWVEQVLGHQQYPKQGRKARGLLRRYRVLPMPVCPLQNRMIGYGLGCFRWLSSF